MTDMKKFEGKNILITGATGLIGRTLIKKIFDWNEKASEPIGVTAMVRKPDLQQGVH